MSRMGMTLSVCARRNVSMRAESKAPRSAWSAQNRIPCRTPTLTQQSRAPSHSGRLALQAPNTHTMLDRLKSWLDAREEARRRQQQHEREGVGAGTATASSSERSAAARIPGLRPRGAGGAKAAGGDDEPYVLVTVGTTKFEALIKCVVGRKPRFAFRFFSERALMACDRCPSALIGPTTVLLDAAPSTTTCSSAPCPQASPQAARAAMATT